jgi:2-polyprenyl-3-methyl-5-hydroxy-6-metoxy-1,4-benzoquinol methylase
VVESVDPRWYDGYFEGEYLDYLALRIDPERTQKEAEFIVGALALEPGARVLDLACGHGRISLELARRGLEVVGVDLSERSLELARSAAEQEGVSIEFVRADMREITFANEFDAVFNIFTAFGYFEEERENQRVLEAVERALKPGGAFLIDTINSLALQARYRPNMWEEVEGTGTLFLQEHSYDITTGRNAARWLFVHPDGARTEISHSVRIYAPHELLRMLEAAGLVIEETWGDFDGAKLTRETWRLIVRARKRA